jgi:hypothetical protein
LDTFISDVVTVRSFDELAAHDMKNLATVEALVRLRELHRRVRAINSSTTTTLRSVVSIMARHGSYFHEDRRRYFKKSEKLKARGNITAIFLAQNCCCSGVSYAIKIWKLTSGTNYSYNFSSLLTQLEMAISL